MNLRKQIKQNGRRCLCNNWGKAMSIVLLSTAIFLLFTIVETIMSMMLGISETVVEYNSLSSIIAGIPDTTLLSMALTIIMSIGAFLIVTPLSLGILGWYRKLSDGESEDILSIFSCFGNRKMFFRSLGLYLNVGIRIFLTGIAYLFLPISGIIASDWMIEQGAASSTNLIGNLGITFSVILLIVLGAFWMLHMQKYFLAQYYLIGGESSVRQAIKQSVHATKGCRDEIFMYKLSFIGWLLSCLAVLPVLYVAPYYQTSTMLYARFLIERDDRSNRLAVYEGVPKEEENLEEKEKENPEEFANTRQFEAQKPEENDC